MAIPHVRSPQRPTEPDEIRCHCGRLLARRIPGGIELQCARCKGRWLVSMPEEGEPGDRLRVTRRP